MSWRERLFGPSKVNRLLSILEAERTDAKELHLAYLDQAKATADLLRRQFDLWTAPTHAPQVRLMTPDIEARYERERQQTTATNAINTDAFMRDLTDDIRGERL